jgi:hypothetical protein
LKTRVFWRRSTPVGVVLLPFLLLLCLAYYFAFAADISSYDGETGLFQSGLNSHDHFVYVDSIGRIRVGDVIFALSNDIGIAAVYVFLSELFPYLVEPTFTILSLVFNCAVLCACYAIYSQICGQLGLGVAGRLSFLANTSVIYFAQLINKDLLTILAFLLAVHFGMRRRLGLLLLLVPALALVRLQLAVFVLVFVYLMHSPRPWTRILLAYAATSLTAGVLSVVASVIGEESIGDGFSAFLIDFNQRYYIGYLLFNPVRVVQYVFDAYMSFFFWNETGGIDTAKLLRLPQLILLLLLVKPLSTLVTQFGFWLNTPARPLVLVVVAFLLAWLMNPTVNARYVMLITPILVLFGLYVQAQQRKGPR